MAALQKEDAPAAQDTVSTKNSDSMAANQNEGLLTTRNKMWTKNPTTNQYNQVPLNRSSSKQKAARPSNGNPNST